MGGFYTYVTEFVNFVNRNSMPTHRLNMHFPLPISLSLTNALPLQSCLLHIFSVFITYTYSISISLSHTHTCLLGFLTYLAVPLFHIYTHVFLTLSLSLSFARMHLSHVCSLSLSVFLVYSVSRLGDFLKF